MARQRSPGCCSRLGDLDNALLVSILLCVSLALLVAGGIITYFAFFSNISVTASAPQHLSVTLAVIGPLLLVTSAATLAAAGLVFRSGGCNDTPTWLQRAKPYSTMSEERSQAAGVDNPGFATAAV